MNLTDENIGDIIEISTCEGKFVGKLQQINSKNISLINVRDEEGVKFPKLRFYLEELTSIKIESSPKDSSRSNDILSKGKMNQTVSKKKELPHHLHPSVYTDSNRIKELLWIAVEEELTSKVVPPFCLPVASSEDLQELLLSCPPNPSDIKQMFVYIDADNKQLLQQVLFHLEQQTQLSLACLGGQIDNFISLLCIGSNQLIVILDLLSLWPEQVGQRIDSRVEALLTSTRYRRILYDSRWLSHSINKRFSIQLGPVIDLQVMDHGLKQLCQEFNHGSVMSLSRLVRTHLDNIFDPPLLIRADFRSADESLWKTRPMCNTLINQALYFIRYLLPLFEALLSQLLRPVEVWSRSRNQRSDNDSLLEQLNHPVSCSKLSRGMKFWLPVSVSNSQSHQNHRNRAEPEGGSDTDGQLLVSTDSKTFGNREWINDSPRSPATSTPSPPESFETTRCKLSNSDYSAASPDNYSNRIPSRHSLPCVSPAENLQVSHNIAEVRNSRVFEETSSRGVSFNPPPLVKLTKRDIKISPALIKPGTYDSNNSPLLRSSLPEGAPGLVDECYSDIPLESTPQSRMLCDLLVNPTPVTITPSAPSIPRVSGRGLANWSKNLVPQVTFAKPKAEVPSGNFEEVDGQFDNVGDGIGSQPLPATSSCSLSPGLSSTVSSFNFGRTRRLSTGLTSALKEETVSPSPLNAPGVTSPKKSLFYGRCKPLFEKR